MKKVSVIVPVYNMEKYLEKCLDSLIAQTLEEIEIIAVDDGSIDASPEILQRYALKSDKIVSVRKENGGLSDARNYGLTYATGEYIGYIDSDDYADPNMYEVMYLKAKERDSDIVECNLHHTYINYEDTEIMTKIYSPEELLCYGRCIVWNKIYKHKWLLETGVIFPQGLIYEDLDFFSRIVPHIRTYDYVDIVPIHYVQRGGSINNTSARNTMQIFSIMRGIISYYKEKGFYNQYERELEYLYARILLCSSFSRMCRISDGGVRKKALRLNWQELSDSFPKWRSNPILKMEKSRNALFMKIQNPFTYKICAKVFPLLLKIEDRKTNYQKF